MGPGRGWSWYRCHFDRFRNLHLDEGHQIGDCTRDSWDPSAGRSRFTPRARRARGGSDGELEELGGTPARDDGVSVEGPDMLGLDE